MQSLFTSEKDFTIFPGQFKSEFLAVYEAIA